MDWQQRQKESQTRVPKRFLTAVEAMSSEGGGSEALLGGANISNAPTFRGGKAWMSF